MLGEVIEVVGRQYILLQIVVSVGVFKINLLGLLLAPEAADDDLKQRLRFLIVCIFVVLLGFFVDTVDITARADFLKLALASRAEYDKTDQRN